MAEYAQQVAALSKLINDGIATFGVELFYEEVLGEAELVPDLGDESVFVASFLMATSGYGPLVGDPTDGAVDVFFNPSEPARDDSSKA